MPAPTPVTGHIHLLLTDVVLPQMSGRELADRLEGVRPDLRALYMPRYTDDILDNASLDADRQLVRTPFTADHLPRKVRDILDLPTP